MDNTELKMNTIRNAPNGDVWISFDSATNGAINFSHISEVAIGGCVVYAQLLHKEKPTGRVFETEEKAQAFYDWICGLINVNKFEG